MKIIFEMDNIYKMFTAKVSTEIYYNPYSLTRILLNIYSFQLSTFQSLPRFDEFLALQQIKTSDKRSFENLISASTASPPSQYSANSFASNYLDDYNSKYFTTPSMTTPAPSYLSRYQGTPASAPAPSSSSRYNQAPAPPAPSPPRHHEATSSPPPRQQQNLNQISPEFSNSRYSEPDIESPKSYPAGYPPKPIKYSEPLSYPNPLDVYHDKNDVELFKPSGGGLNFQNFPFERTVTSGRNIGRGAAVFAPVSSSNLINTGPNQIQTSGNRFVSSHSSSKETKYMSQSFANNIKSYETATKTPIISPPSSVQPAAAPLSHTDNNLLSTEARQLGTHGGRRTSVPVAKSGWKILDTIEPAAAEEDGGDYDYGDYEYDYRWSAPSPGTRRAEGGMETQFSRLHFNILSSPADVPRLGVQADFRPIELIYNEMFQGDTHRGQPGPGKHARSFDFITSEHGPAPTPPGPAPAPPATTRPPLLPTPPPPAIQQRRHYHTQPPLNRRILDTQTQSSDNCLSNQNFESTRTLVKRRKKSIPGHTSRDGVSSESILHAIVQSELFSLQNEEAI